MARREFPKSVKVAVIKRATKTMMDGKTVIICEKCGGLAKRFQIDHVIPDGLGGEPVLTNAELICEPCYQVKNPKDTSDIAQAKRREVRHLGADRGSKSRGFPAKSKQPGASTPPKLASLPRHQIYKDAQ